MHYESCTACIKFIFNGKVYHNLQQCNSTPRCIRPRVHKAFQNQAQDQAQVNNYFTMDFFKTYFNYLTIGCWFQ